MGYNLCFSQQKQHYILEALSLRFLKLIHLKLVNIYIERALRAIAKLVIYEF